MRKIPRTPLLYLAIGAIGGIIISRNAEPMGAPSKGSIILCILVSAFVFWRAGNKGKAEAVATAVAVAVAEATAKAESHANAVAQQAVAVYIGAQRQNEEIYGESLKFLDTVTDSSSITASDTTKEIDHGFDSDSGQRHGEGERISRTRNPRRSRERTGN